MANPRQRRKTKSSTHKPISHSKRAKRLLKKMPAIRGPKSLQEAWDSSKTLRQNYLALGLQHDLNPISSGGSEANSVRTTGQISQSRLHPAASSPRNDGDRSSASEVPAATGALPEGFGRIVRDSFGNVVRVELPKDEETQHASKQEQGVDTPLMTTECELRIWADDHPQTWQEGDSGSRSNTFVQDLENLAASGTTPQRHISSGERSYLERLVKKYDNDLQKMARDRRLNPDQRTANELRRSIAKVGGTGALCKGTVVGTVG